MDILQKVCVSFLCVWYNTAVWHMKNLTRTHESQWSLVSSTIKSPKASPYTYHTVMAVQGDFTGRIHHQWPNFQNWSKLPVFHEPLLPHLQPLSHYSQPGLLKPYCKIWGGRFFGFCPFNCTASTVSTGAQGTLPNHVVWIQAVLNLQTPDKTQK